VSAGRARALRKFIAAGCRCRACAHARSEARGEVAEVAEDGPCRLAAHLGNLESAALVRARVVALGRRSAQPLALVFALAFALAGCFPSAGFTASVRWTGDDASADTSDGDTSDGEDQGDDTSEAEGDGDGDGDECEAGAHGCQCDGDECEAGLACIAGVCVDPGCDGHEGCECYPTATCWPGLVCESGVCEAPAVCQAGEVGCECIDGSVCGPGLVCDLDTITCEMAPAPCPEGSDGCPCYGGETCDHGLACDVDSWTCEVDVDPCPPGSEGCDCDGWDSCEGDLMCLGWTCVDGPCDAVLDLAAGYGGFDLVSVPVIGAMSDDAIADACAECGFVIPCGTSASDDPLQLWDNACVQIWPAFTQIGGRVIHQMIGVNSCGNYNTAECHAVWGLFAYSAGAYAGGAPYQSSDGPSIGPVGIVQGVWVGGNDHDDQRAICAE
jgi:hypothetical protein